MHTHTLVHVHFVLRYRNCIVNGTSGCSTVSCVLAMFSFLSLSRVSSGIWKARVDFVISETMVPGWVLGSDRPTLCLSDFGIHHCSACHRSSGQLPAEVGRARSSSATSGKHLSLPSPSAPPLGPSFRRCLPSSIPSVHSLRGTFGSEFSQWGIWLFKQ